MEDTIDIELSEAQPATETGPCELEMCYAPNTGCGWTEDVGDTFFGQAPNTGCGWTEETLAGAGDTYFEQDASSKKLSGDTPARTLGQ